MPNIKNQENNQNKIRFVLIFLFVYIDIKYRYVSQWTPLPVTLPRPTGRETLLYTIQENFTIESVIAIRG